MVSGINVLVFGGAGARETALLSIAKRSSLVDQVHCFATNAQIARMKGITVAAMPKNSDRIINYCAANDIELVIVGPEQPLADGLADELRKAGILVFGPGQRTAQLESSKLFGREFCERHGVPHPNFSYCTSLQEALSKLDEFAAPYVIKLDGLAGGKGVTIHHTVEQAEDRLRTLYDSDPDTKLLLEQFLPDNPDMLRSEISVHVLISGSSYQILPTTQDYKPRFDGDKGLMTGGMGCFGPVPGVEMDVIEQQIVVPVVKGLLTEGIDYRGVLYAGLKLCPDSPNVVEWNVRFGDPEMVILDQLVTSDLMPLIIATAKGQDLTAIPLDLFEGSAVGVVIVNQKYPDKGPDCTFFRHLDTPNTYHAATKLVKENSGDSYRVEACGGRIAVVTRRRGTISAAREAVYDQITRSGLGGLDCREDIAEGY